MHSIPGGTNEVSDTVSEERTSFSSKIFHVFNCGEVCASQLVPLRHKPREDDDFMFYCELNND